MFVDWFFLKRSDGQRNVIAFLRSVLKEVGTALHALWRVLAGAFFAIPILWAIAEPETFHIAKVATFLWVGAIVLAECWAFSWAISFLERYPRVRSL
ncbi:hypothetical protein D3C77_717400 [compost metagenome]